MFKKSFRRYNKYTRSSLYNLFLELWGQVKSMSNKKVKLSVPTPNSWREKLTDEEKDIAYGISEHQIKHLAGKVLTVIDASIAEEKQNKAMKDLVKQYFRETIFEFQDFWYFRGDNAPRKGHSVDLDNLGR